MLPSSRLRRLLAVPLVGGLAALAVPATTAPAEASSTYLCTGYAGCAAAGYSSSGYATHSRTMYWRMYSGHNCTNYVAYRMVEAGMPTERPWAGSGMARNWGPANPDITDQTPAVGAVAWFSRGLSGGVDGHVAYVERVISPTQIVISEDMWNGDFHWAVLTKDGGTWPSGFIHFVDQHVIAATSAPHVTGTPRVGVALSMTRGAWDPAGATFARQWLADGVAIPGATGASYTPTAAQEGQTITARVTAAKAGFTTGTSTSAPTTAVAPGTLANSGAPVIGGDPIVGQALTLTPGRWTPTPDLVGIRWKADGTVIKGADTTTLTLTKALLGKTITVDEVVRKSGYAKTDHLSAPLGPVVAGTIQVATPYQPQGSTHYGNTLTVTSGTVTPADAAVTYVWSRDGVAVPGASAATYALTAADLGHHISATLTFTKAHYASTTQRVDFATPVTATPALSLTTEGKRQAVIARGTLTAPGLGALTGPVTVTVGKHRVVGQLAAGRFWLRLPGLTSGPRRVVVSYAGSSTTDPARSARMTTVLRGHKTGHSASHSASHSTSHSASRWSAPRRRH